MIDRFSWRSYDLNTLLPADWQEVILSVSEDAVAKTLKPRSVTSREGDPNLNIPVLTVNGTIVKERLPWLHSLYEGLFRELAQDGTHETVATADPELLEFVRSYNEVVTEDFHPLRTQLVHKATKILKQYAREERSEELATGAYYQWLLPKLERTQPGDRVWAVSMMMECEFHRKLALGRESLVVLLQTF